MNESSGKSSRPADVFSWDARLRSPECTDADRAAFEAWRDASPANRQAFDELQSMLTEGLRSVAHDPSVRSIREVALEAVGARKPWYRRTWPLGLAAAAVAALAIGLTVLQTETSNVEPPVAMPIFATAVGERSTTELEDGSVATLNTDTRIAISYTDDERLVTLVHGQALFDVAKDPDRPFVVVAGEQRITAIGTVFDVRFEGTEIEVTLVEGLVEVQPDEASAPALTSSARRVEPVRLVSGQSLRTSATGTDQPPAVETVDADQATLWRQGQVFFDDVPLSEAAAEMNRYSTVQIVVEDASLDMHRVNGMFRTGRQTTFVDAIEAYFPVSAEQTGDNRIVLNPRNGAE